MDNLVVFLPFIWGALLIFPGVFITLCGCHESWTPNKSASIGTLYTFVFLVMTDVYIISTENFYKVTHYFMLLMIPTFLSIQSFFGYRAIAVRIMGKEKSASETKEELKPLD